MENNSTVRNDDFDREAWAQRKQEERDGMYELLGSKSDEIKADPAALVAYLDVQSRFPKMSVSNAILIAAQRPDATQVGSFDFWKSKKASIKSGEKGFSIMESGRAYTRQDGSEGHYTNVKKVFDVSQTSIKNPYKQPTPDIQTVMRAMSNCDVAIEVDNDLPNNVTAEYVPEEHTVYYRRGIPADRTFAAVSRALATAALCKDGSTPAENSFASYAASYMLCKRYGIDTAPFSFSTAPNLFKDMDAWEVRAELNRARSAAEEISSKMDKTVFPRQHERSDKKDAR